MVLRQLAFLEIVVEVEHGAGQERLLLPMQIELQTVVLVIMLRAIILLTV